MAAIAPHHASASFLLQSSETSPDRTANCTGPHQENYGSKPLVSNQLVLTIERVIELSDRQKRVDVFLQLQLPGDGREGRAF